MGAKPTNEYYVIAVNADNTYPITRESHEVEGEPSPEVEPDAFLTTGYVIPDGHIIPYKKKEPEPIRSLYRTGKTWGDIADLTWGQVSERFVW